MQAFIVVEWPTQAAAEEQSENPRKTFSSWKHSRHTEGGSLKYLIWFLHYTIADNPSVWTDGGGAGGLGENKNCK